MTKNRPPAAGRGFTLIEMLAVLAIIGVLSTLTVAAVLPALKKGRDAKRKAALSQIGRMLASSSCYVPDAGTGDYDLGDLFAEVMAKNPQYSQFVSSPPKDPSGGTDAVTKYRYVVNGDASGCALYANLEYDAEAVTLGSLSAPTPGAGTGVLKASAEGPNGSDKYFQVSNK